MKLIKKYSRYFVILCMVVMTLPFFGVYASEEQGHQERVFTADDGLPTTSSLALAQTPDGFIWIGGYGGLSRYDGHEFKTFSDSRASNIVALETTKEGNLWMSSLDYGLIRYEKGKFIYFDETRCDKPPVDIEALSESDDGILYFAASDGIGFVNYENEVVWIEDPSLKGEAMIGVACGKNDTVWCVSKEGKVYSVSTDRKYQELNVTEEKIRCIKYDEYTDCFFIGTEENSVIRCSADLEEKTIYELDHVTNINEFGFPEKDSVIVCTDDGVIKIDKKSITHQTQKIVNSIEDMIVDSNGNQWYASSRQGVLLVSHGRFKDISGLIGMNEMIVNSIVCKDGLLYIGHDNGYVILDEKTYRIVSDESLDFLTGKRIRQMFFDSDDRMWVCTTGDGLFKRNTDGTWQSYSTATEENLMSDKFRAIIETSEGIIAATDAGAYIINDEGVELLTSAVDMRVLSLIEANGMIYAGTDGQGIYVIKDRKIVKRITSEDGLSSMRIMKMIKCSGERGLWMATGNNLDYMLFETGQILHAETFPSVNVLDCYLTDEETLWILAGNGIYQTTETALVRDDSSRNYHHYSKRNGIPYDFTANSFSTIVGDHAYLCGAEGIAWMNIEPEYTNPKQYSIIIDDIKMDDNSVYVQDSDSVTIGSDVRRLEISAHMATYTQENPTMFYYLDGFDDTYHYISFDKLTPFIYTNLPGGDYTFHFGVYDPSTASTGQEKTLDLHVEYEWYERPYVRIYILLGITLVLGGLTYGFFKLRSKREKYLLEQSYKEREKNILKKQAFTDYLTGLYNRNYLGRFDESHIDERVFPVNFVAIDCNNLKLVNDNFGHDEGDALLRTLSDYLKKYFPGDREHIIRLGGDEFMIITEGLTADEADSRMMTISVEASAVTIGDYPISFCYGIATCEDPKEYDFKKLAQEADEIMVTNKQMYHSRVFDDNKPLEIYEVGTGSRVERHVKHNVLSNILYEAFAEASDNVYIYAMDMNTGVTRWSKNCVDFFGLTAEYMKGGEAEWFALIHPDDVDAYNEDITAVLTGKKMRHAYQYRIRNRFNQYVWVECKGSVIRSANGRNIFAGMITRLDNQSIYDPLTGLRTKNQFYDYMEKYEKGIVLDISIDDFKEIINTYGYENGDKVLGYVSKMFMKHSNAEHEVFRFGGPEFVYIIPAGTEEDAEKIFATIVEEATDITLENGVRLNVRYTASTSYFDKSSMTTDDVVNNMELALEHAKENKIETVVHYSEKIQDVFRRLTLLKKEMKKSIRNGFEGFELYYQPLIENCGKKVIGCEALLRWKNDVVKDSYPAEFIPILEESGDIIEVGRFVMREAMRQQKIWSEKYGEFIVSFNVSYYQFLTEGYVEDLIKTAKEVGVDPSNMIIELTESRSVQSPKILAGIFEELRSYGFRIMLDDFGTGYSSLEMLKILPSDGIKIEHNFVRDIGKEGHDIDLSIIRSIVGLCGELGKLVIVEGVENGDVDEIISNMQVSFLQGYYYSKPIETNCFEDWLEQNGRTTL